MPADHVALLTDFVAALRRGEAEDLARIDLKLDHSLRVLDEARMLTRSLGMAPDRAQVVHLAALYHDIGRFPQYLRFKTFRDPASVNHARLGVATLRRTGFLDALPAAIRRTVYGAIMVHNRAVIPSGFARRGDGPPPGALLAARIVRDADKLDIVRVMLGHFAAEGDNDPVVVLHLAPADGRASPSILEALKKCRVAAYEDMRHIDDMRLLLLSWLADLNFEVSRRAFFERGYVARLLGGLSDGLDKAGLGAHLKQRHLPGPAAKGT